MAWICSAASAASPWPCGPGCGRSAMWSPSRTARPCFAPAWPNAALTARLCGMTSPPLRLSPGLVPWTSSPQDSPARTSALRAAEQAWRESEPAYGARSSGLPVWWDPASSSWRTSQASLLPMEDGTDGPLPVTLPRWGTMRGGACCRLTMWARRTSGSGGGAWPTPSASLWPSPTVGDSKSARNSTAKRRREPPTGVHAGNTLTDAVTLWPSPAARDSRSGLGRQPNGHTPQLAETVGGRLNPTWVEWLMGFPTGWTVCAAWVTQWCRKPRRKRGAA